MTVTILFTQWMSFPRRMGNLRSGGHVPTSLSCRSNHRTPRECVPTAAGRAEVDLLLKDMEHMEQRARGVPFDVSTIRRELGIAMH